MGSELAKDTVDNHKMKHPSFQSCTEGKRVFAWHTTHRHQVKYQLDKTRTKYKSVKFRTKAKGASCLKENVNSFENRVFGRRIEAVA